MRSRNKPEYQLKIAAERIELLFKEAAKAANPEMAKNYVRLAKKIGMRYNVRIPKKFKRMYCKYCFSFLAPDNSKMRLKGGRLNVKCFSCNKTMRYLYKRKV
ncbi:MAG: hypothetical protein HYT72_04755 [Candidatus Aenigmarchaeota archaeon]|nr:hypothetical protein [Candidatus Aenigmarchaeota archaeon]